MRNLKYKVQTFGSNELHREHTSYIENFYMEFRESDIMLNYKLFCMPKQLCKLATKNAKTFPGKDKRNLKEMEILENQVLVLAKFINPKKIMYEFRLLKNFQKIFEREARYTKRFDSYDHGMERIQAFCEVQTSSHSSAIADNELRISLNVIDSQMINQYVLYFEQSPSDLSLRYQSYKHQISYANQLSGMNFTGKLVFDSDGYETYLLANEFDFN